MSQSNGRNYPDWPRVCEELRDCLLDSIDEMDESLALGAEPLVVTINAVNQIKAFIEALENDGVDD